MLQLSGIVLLILSTALSAAEDHLRGSRTLTKERDAAARSQENFRQVQAEIARVQQMLDAALIIASQGLEPLPLVRSDGRSLIAAQQPMPPLEADPIGNDFEGQAPREMREALEVDDMENLD